MGKFVELKLPEFAFIESSVHEQGTENDTQGRNIVTHIRSGAIIEFFPRDKVRFMAGTKTFTWEYENELLGIKEEWTSAVHVTGIINYKEDEDFFIKMVLKPAIRWFMCYLEAEDNNIKENGM